jgi:hypothetical protein
MSFRIVGDCRESTPPLRLDELREWSGSSSSVFHNVAQSEHHTTSRQMEMLIAFDLRISAPVSAFLYASAVVFLNEHLPLGRENAETGAEKN